MFYAAMFRRKKNIRRFVLKNNHLSYINTYVHIANKKLVSLYDISTKHMIKTYTKQRFSEKRYTKKKKSKQTTQKDRQSMHRNTIN